MVEENSGQELILLRFTKPTSGIWKFNVYEKEGFAIGFHIWLPMGKFISDNTYFVRSDPYTTLLSPGNIGEVVIITSYNAEDGRQRRGRVDDTGGKKCCCK
jgi:hypothetical protein